MAQDLAVALEEQQPLNNYQAQTVDSNTHTHKLSLVAAAAVDAIEAQASNPDKSSNLKGSNPYALCNIMQHI